MSKREVYTVFGCIRECKPLCPHEIIQIIFHFYFVAINQIFAIGENVYGQLGTGDDNDLNTLTMVKSYDKMIKTIINGYGCVYLIFDDYSYECSGNNQSGQLGLNIDHENVNTFVKNDTIKIDNIFSNPFSYNAFCIEHNTKNIYSCGDNYTKKWSKINTQMKIKTIATGNGYTMFLNLNGNLFVHGNDKCAGSMVLGLGIGINEVKTITQIQSKTKFVNVYCGELHTLALDVNRKIWSWGYGSHGRLGHGNEDSKYIPTKIKWFMNKNIDILHICCGYDHNLVLSNNNKLYVFGYNGCYQCGNGNNSSVLIPEINETLKNENIIDIKCGFDNNMAKTNTNKYYLWGNNFNNQCLDISGSECVEKPLLFELKCFINTHLEIVDIFLGLSSTIVLIGNTNH